jgi:hypothetical protein
VALVCDSCPARLGDDDAGEVHFGSVEQAREYCEGWQIGEDGSAVCDRCLARRACAAQGHDWDRWRDCPCEGLLSTHAVSGCVQARWCNRCDDRQERPGRQVDPAARRAAQLASERAGLCLQVSAKRAAAAALRQRVAELAAADVPGLAGECAGLAAQLDATDADLDAAQAVLTESGGGVR